MQNERKQSWSARKSHLHRLCRGSLCSFIAESPASNIKGTAGAFLTLTRAHETTGIARTPKTRRPPPAPAQAPASAFWPHSWTQCSTNPNVTPLGTEQQASYRTPSPRGAVARVPGNRPCAIPGTGPVCPHSTAFATNTAADAGDRVCARAFILRAKDGERGGRIVCSVQVYVSKRPPGRFPKGPSLSPTRSES